LHLDGKGICASTGAACNSNDKAPSRVLKALGISDEDALSSIRFSLSHDNTEDEIGFIATVIEEFYKNR
jgi:cysteine desulfurase